MNILSKAFLRLRWKQGVPARKRFKISIIICALFCMNSLTVYAEPEGGNVVAGEASIATNSYETIVNQLTDKAIINWDSFSIDNNELVKFIQPGVNSVALNRVMGGDPSVILGELSANGNVFLINPNGILFGSGSKIDVAGLLATTFDISDNDFLNENYDFAQKFGMDPSYVINRGDITVGANGFVYLAAPGVENSGLIMAELSQVGLGSGDSFTLDFNGDGLIKFEVSGKVLEEIKNPEGGTMDSAVSNEGTINNEGGMVLLTGDAGNEVMGSVVNNSGIIEAKSLVMSEGSVTLEGRGAGKVLNSGDIDVSAVEAGADGGSIYIEGSMVGQFGNIYADAIDGDGGNVDIYADDVLAMSSDSFISVNAGLNGDGGTVITFSPETTLFWDGALIEAKGGTVSGDGGFVEVSGIVHVEVYGDVDTSAVNGIGGTFYLDPYNINITATANANGSWVAQTWTPTSDASVVTPASILTALTNGNTVIIDAVTAGAGSTGVITVSSEINLSGETGILRLKAYTNLDQNAAIINIGNGMTLELLSQSDIDLGANITCSGTGNVTIKADSDAENNGALTQSAGTITMAGGDLLLYAGHGIGSVGTPIATAGVTDIAATTVTGGIYITNSTSGNMNITTVDGIVGLSTTTSGDITIINNGGNITSDLGATTAITADAGTDTVSLTLGGAADYIGTSGTTLLIDTITLNATTNAGDIYITDASGGLEIGAVTTTAQTKTVSITATGGAITSDGLGTDIIGSTITLITTGSSNAIGVSGTPITIDGITLNATTVAGNVYVKDIDDASFAIGDETVAGIDIGTITTGGNSAIVSIEAQDGSITATGSGIDITCATLSLVTSASDSDTTNGGAIGSSAVNGEIETNMTTFSATAENGGIYIDQTAATALTINAVTAQTDGVAAYQDASGNVVISTSASGSFDIEITSAATITSSALISSPNALTITISGAGNDLVDGYDSTNFLAQALTLNVVDEVGTSSDSMEMVVETINVTAADNLYLTEGNILIIGDVDVTTNVVITADSGDIALGTIDSVGDITVTSEGGTITDNNGGTTNITTTGAVTLSAYDTGLGTSADPIETASGTLDLTTEVVSAPIYIDETNEPTAITVSTKNSLVDIDYDLDNGIASDGAVDFNNSNSQISLTLADGDTAINFTFENTNGGIVHSGLSVGTGTVSLTASAADADAVATIRQTESNKLVAATATLSGTAVGASGTPILTTVGTLTATASNGGVYITETDAVTVSASATATDTTDTKDIVLVNSGGDMTINLISATGAVTLTASEDLLDGNGATTNVLGTSLIASAGTGAIGTSGNLIESSVTGAVALSSAIGVYVTNIGSITNFDASASNTDSARDITFTNIGSIALDEISTNGTVTLSVSTDITDNNTGTTNITAATLVVSSKSFGTSDDVIETDVTTFNSVVTTSGGIFITEGDNDAVTITTMTAGGPGSNIAFINGGNIALGAMSAEGDSVTLTSNNGNITDGNGDDTNVTAYVFNVKADNGTIGSGDALELDVDKLIPTGSSTVTATNSGAIYIESADLTTGSNINISADEITIFDNSGGSTSITGTLTLTANYGSIVFLETTDTLSASGNITLTASCDGSEEDTLPGRIVCGNLTSSGNGNIELTAYSDITIGLLNAGSGDVTINSSTGLILDGNGSLNNIVAATASLTAVMPTVKLLGENRSDAVSKYDSRETNTSSNLTIKTTWTSNYTILAAAQSTANSDYNTASDTYDDTETSLNVQNLILEIFDGINTVYVYARQAAQIIKDAFAYASAAGQAIPFTGDGGADLVFATVDLAFDITDTAQILYEQFVLNPQEDVVSDLENSFIEATADLYSSDNTLALATAAMNGSSEAVDIATADYNAAVIAQQHAWAIRSQADTADEVTNAIGSLTQSLGINATTTNITTTGEDSDIYVETPVSTGFGFGTMSIGGSSSNLIVDAHGAVSVTGNATIPGTLTLTVDTNGGVNDGGSGRLIADTLDITTAGASDIPVKVNNLTVTSSSGNLLIDNIDRDITVTSGGISGVSNVKLITNTALTLNGTVTSGSNGYVILTASGGDINVNQSVTANGSGNILLQTTTSSDYDIAIAANVTSTTGHITIESEGALTVAANYTISTGTAGTMSLDAEGGALTMAGTSNAAATSSSLRLEAANDLTVGNLTAANISLVSNSGSILSAAGSTTNATGTNLRLNVDDKIGASGTSLTTDVTTLSASSTGTNATGIYITEANSVTVDNVSAISVTEISSINGTSTVTDAAQADLVTGNNGDIVFTATAGTITLNDGDSDNTVITANGSGTITITANGSGSTSINAAITSTSGNITINANDDVIFSATGDVTNASGGNISITADANSDSNGLGGALTMNDGTLINAGEGTITLEADESITLGGLLTTSSSATAVTLTSTSGGIVDGGGGDLVDVVAASGRLVIDAATGIGTGGALETTVASVDLNNSTSGNISIIETNALTIAGDGVITEAGNGSITLLATAGTITVDSVITAHGTGVITITADTGGAVNINAAVSSTTGNVIINADDSIALAANVTTTGTGDVYLTADHSDVGTVGAITRTAGTVSGDLVDLSASTGIGSAAGTTNSVYTSATTLEATNSTSGNIAIIEATDVSLAANGLVTSAGNGSIILTTTDGSITAGYAVTAHGSGSILVSAGGSGKDLTINANITSTTGHVTLKAADAITVAAGKTIQTSVGSGSGTISMDAILGVLTMLCTEGAGTSNVTVTNSSAALHAGSDLTIGNVTATNVSLLSDNGAIINAADSTKNVTATNLRINADDAIGASDRHITTAVTNLTALSTGTDSAGMYITEDTAVEVKSVAVTVTDFNSDLSTSVETDATQSDLTTGTNGNIVLKTTAGTITLSDGADDDDNSVVAHGSGNILVTAGGTGSDITINDDVESTTGHVTLKAADAITLAAGRNVSTGTSGTISMDAIAGVLTMLCTEGAGVSNVTATGSSAALHAGSDLTIGNVTATNVSLLSDSGAIINAADSTKNVTATSLRINADDAIGTSSRHITTDVTNITALSTGTTSAGIYITEDDAVEVTSVQVVVTDFNSNATTSTITDATQSDLTTGTNGNIVLKTTAGTITLSDGADDDDNSVVAHGSGNILVTAGGTGSDITINDDVESTTGHVTLKAADAITLAAGRNVSTGTSGTISMDAIAGVLTMLCTEGAGVSNVTATGSSAALHADGNVTVGNVTATNVSLLSDNGAIINAADSTKNVTATSLRINADDAIGTSSRHITTDVTNITALSTGTTSAGIYITEDDAVTVTSVEVAVTDFNSDATTSTETDVSQADLVTGNNGFIVFSAEAGTITLNDGTDDDDIAVSANGSGTIAIDAAGATSDIIVNSGISGTLGTITLTADNDITFAAEGDITSTSGNISVTADSDVIDDDPIGGAITMANGALINAGSAIITLTADENIVLGGLLTTNTGNTSVNLTSVSGGVTDAGDSHVDVVSGGRLVVDTKTGIGSAGALETTIASADLDNSTSGNIQIIETDDITIVKAVEATTGNIDIQTSAGTLTLDSAGNPTNVVSTLLTGTITLNAVGSASDIIVNDRISSATGTIILTADNDITFAAEGDIINTSGTVTITADSDVTEDAGSGGAITMANGALINAGSALIALTADENIAVGGLLTTSESDTSVTLTSVSGGVIDAGDSDVDVVSGGRLVIDTKTGIGSAGALETTIVSADLGNTTSGNIQIVETDNISIAGDGIITEAGDGNINLLATAGTITVNSVVTAHGLGTVTITADGAGSVNIDAVVSSTSGNVTINADDNIAISANVSTTGDVALTADYDESEDGAITRTAGTVIGDLVDIAAATGIGSAGGSGSVYTTATTLEAENSTLNNISIIETNDVSIATNGITTGGDNGNIILRTIAGAITVANVITADGSGNIYVSAVGAVKDLTINDDITSGIGHITLLAGRSVITGDDGDVSTTGGTIDVEAGADAITMDDNSLIDAGTGNVRLVAVNDITLGGISTTGDVGVTSTSGSVLDAGDTYVEVTAGGLRLNTAVGVGTSSNALETSITTVSARATSGGVNLLETNGITIDNVAVSVSKVGVTGAVTTVTDAAQSDVLTTAGGGSVQIITSAGDITINDGTAPEDDIGISSVGNVVLNAAGSIDQNATITTTGTGNITLTAGDDISVDVIIADATDTTGAGGIITLNSTTITDSNGTDPNITGGTINLNSNNGSVVAETLVAGGDLYQKINVNGTPIGGLVTDTELYVPLNIFEIINLEMVDEVMPTDIFVPVPGNINVNLVSNPVITVEPVI